MNHKNHMSNSQKSVRIIQWIGMALITGLSLLYAIFRQRVSEKFVMFPFLNFPVFVGEIVMGVCLLLLAVKLFLDYRNKELKFNWPYFCIFLYCVWIAGMGLSGFAKVGAYAFRNAALFYYALFAVMGVHFYHRDIFNKTAPWLLAAMAILIAGEWITLYFQLPLLLVFIFLLWNYKKRWMKAAGFIFLLVIFLLKFSGVAFIYRSHMAGVFGVVVFLFFFFLRYAPGSNRIGRGLIVAVFFVVLIFIYIFLGHSVRRSLDFDGRMTEYRHFDGYVQNNKNFFVFYEVPPRIYQDDAVKYRRRPLTGKEYQEVHEPFPDKAMVWPAGDWPGPNLAQNFIRVEAEQPVQDNKSDLFSRFVSKHKGRNIQQSRNQILFRIFIWRDMLADLRSHPYYFITGVGFHRSQRSHSIEILGWGRQEWGRDGWITPHNSFFNMIYRGGVIGWALLGAIMFLIVQMTKDFGRLRIFSGGLLVASLVYWIVISNFLVYLEVPHTAIPFWSLLGVVCAYWKDRLRERPALQR